MCRREDRDVDGWGKLYKEVPIAKHGINLWKREMQEDMV